MKRAKSSRVSHALFGSESTHHVPLRSTWCYRPNACSARRIGPTIRAFGLFRQAPRFKIPRYSTKGILESWNSGIFSSLIRNKVDFDERNLIRRVRFCRAPAGLYTCLLWTCDEYQTQTHFSDRLQESNSKSKKGPALQCVFSVDSVFLSFLTLEFLGS